MGRRGRRDGPVEYAALGNCSDAMRPMRKQPEAGNKETQRKESEEKEEEEREGEGGGVLCPGEGGRRKGRRRGGIYSTLSEQLHRT